MLMILVLVILNAAKDLSTTLDMICEILRFAQNDRVKGLNLDRNIHARGQV